MKLNFLRQAQQNVYTGGMPNQSSDQFIQQLTSKKYLQQKKNENQPQQQTINMIHKNKQYLFRVYDQQSLQIPEQCESLYHSNENDDDKSTTFSQIDYAKNINDNDLLKRLYANERDIMNVTDININKSQMEKSLFGEALEKNYRRSFKTNKIRRPFCSQQVGLKDKNQILYYSKNLNGVATKQYRT